MVFAALIINTAMRFCQRNLINELLNENVNIESKNLKDYERTTLNPCIQLFKKFLINLESSWKNKRIAISGKLNVLIVYRQVYSVKIFVNLDAKMEF